MNKKGFTWVIPVLAIAIAISACGGDDGDGGGGMAKLEFKSEQVWSISSTGTYSAYDSDNVLTSNAGGAGSIVGGKLTFSIETPTQSRLQPMGTFLTSIDDKFKIFSDAEWNPSSPVPNVIEFSFASPSLKKANNISDETSTTEQSVRYIYVDTDCTLKAPGKPNTSIAGVSVPVNVSALDLSLKKGWNIINSQMTFTSTGGTAAWAIGELESCKWIIE
jgi:hypothetical protein